VHCRSSETRSEPPVACHPAHRRRVAQVSLISAFPARLDLPAVERFPVSSPYFNPPVRVSSGMPPTLLRTLRIAKTPVNVGLVHGAAAQLDKIVVAKLAMTWQRWSRAARIAITRGAPKQSAGAWRPVRVASWRRWKRDDTALAVGHIPCAQ